MFFFIRKVKMLSGFLYISERTLQRYSKEASELHVLMCGYIDKDGKSD